MLARIGTLGVSGVSAQVLMNEAVKETAAALEVELCKILIPENRTAISTSWRKRSAGGTHRKIDHRRRDPLCRPGTRFGNGFRWW